jgi:hypothetical protein
MTPESISVKLPDVGRNASFYCRAAGSDFSTPIEKWSDETWLHGLLGRQKGFRPGLCERCVCVPGAISQLKLSGSPSFEERLPSVADVRWLLHQDLQE